MHSAGNLDAPVDTTLLVITPEHVRFDFQLAGPFHRLSAFIIDAVAIISIGSVSSVVLANLGTVGQGFSLFIWFILLWGYGGLFETYWNGQTPGKRAVGMRVVSRSGLTINAQQAVLRNVLRGVDIFPPLFAGLFAMLCSRQFQRLGDLAADTIVIREGRLRPPDIRWGHSIPEEFNALIPPNFRPDAQLIEVLGRYVGRRNDFSPLRRTDLSIKLAKHFIRAWSLPGTTDPDQLLCAMFSRAVSSREQLRTSQRESEPWRGKTG